MCTRVPGTFISYYAYSTGVAELVDSNCDSQVAQSNHQFLATDYHSRVHQWSFVSRYKQLPLSIRLVQFV